MPFFLARVAKAGGVCPQCLGQAGEISVWWRGHVELIASWFNQKWLPPFGANGHHNGLGPVQGSPNSSKGSLKIIKMISWLFFRSSVCPFLRETSGRRQLQVQREEAGPEWGRRGGRNLLREDAWPRLHHQRGDLTSCSSNPNGWGVEQVPFRGRACENRPWASFEPKLFLYKNWNLQAWPYVMFNLFL